MSVFYTGDWHAVVGTGSVSRSNDFYRKVELYTMTWSPQTDLNNYSLVGATYGGPLAMIRDDKKFLRVTPSVPVKPVINIYNAAGIALSSVKWDSGILIKMGWSTAEDLLCVQEDGNVLVYNMCGTSKQTVPCPISSESKEKAFEAEIFPSNNGTGIAYLTTKNNFVVMNNYKDAKVRRYASVPGDVSLTAWSVISANRQTQIVAAKDTFVFLVDASQSNQVFPEFSSKAGMNSPITYISVSLNGLHIALLTESGVLWLGKADFSEKYCEHSSGVRTKPKQIVWCGEDAIVMSWDTSLLLVDCKGSTLTLSMDSQFCLIPEIDSVRIVTNVSHEILQLVPKVTRDIFGIGSVAPGSVLMEASKKYMEGSHKADEYMRMISDVEKAVEECIQAAGHEFHTPTQKNLLKAAQFGKCFLTKYSPENYVHMCQMLRILNAVKDFRIAIPLTHTQLEVLTVSVLIDRLILRQHYSMAIKIAEFLKLRESQGRSRILAHWACYKVSQTHLDESKLANEIYSKLKSDTNISYSEIANKANEAGRKKLALNLAHYEVRRSVQVPLFLELGDSTTALHKAVESGDSNLIYKVLLQLRDNMSLSDFMMLIRKYPMAQSLYIKYCNTGNNSDTIRMIYEQEDDFMAQGLESIKDSYTENKIESRLAALMSAQEQFKKAKNEFMVAMCEEQHKLLKHQQAYGQKFGKTFLDLPLRETIKELLMLKENKLAENLRTEFKVTEKMFWWIKLQTLGEMHEWAEIEKMSKVKKMPGGFEDLVEVCLLYGNRTEALKYLPKVKEDLQIKCYVQAKFYEEAAKIAFNQKNESGLQYIYSKCIGTDRATAEKVKTIIEHLKTMPPVKNTRR